MSEALDLPRDCSLVLIASVITSLFLLLFTAHAHLDFSAAPSVLNQDTSISNLSNLKRFLILQKVFVENFNFVKVVGFPFEFMVTIKSLDTFRLILVPLLVGFFYVQT